MQPGTWVTLLSGHMGDTCPGPRPPGYRSLHRLCGSGACAGCGWERDRSRRSIGAAGEFEFERLASGAYLVRIVDERGHEAATPARVRLGVDETLRVDVRIARARTVDVALDDVDGSPLNRVWSERLARPVPDRVALSTMSVLKWSAGVLDGEFLVAEGELSTPNPIGTALRMGRSTSTYSSTGRSWTATAVRGSPATR